MRYSGTKHDKDKIAMFTMGCAVFSTFVFGADVFEEIVIDYFAQHLCSAAKYAKIVSSHAALVSSYMVFWERHKTLYDEPALKHLTSPCLRSSSRVSYVTLFAVPFSKMCMHMLDFTFSVTPNGCDATRSSIPREVTLITSILAAIAVHSLLLYPFVRPLMKHSEETRVQTSYIKPLVIRSLVCGLISAIADIVTFSFYAMKMMRTGYIAKIFVHGCITTTVIMTVVAFPTWQSTVFPFLREDENEIQTPPAEPRACEVVARSKSMKMNTVAPCP